MQNSDFISIEELTNRWKIRDVDIKFLMNSVGLEFHNKLPKMEKGRLRYTNTHSVHVPDYYFWKADVEKYEQDNPYLTRQDTPDVSKQGEVPPYMDKKHEHFSKELFMAVRAWMFFFGPDGCYNPEKSHITNVQEFIDKNFPTLGDEVKNVVKRIATITNPVKSGKIGGRPKKSKNPS